MKAKLERAHFEPSSKYPAAHERMWSEITCSFSWPDREERPFLDIFVNQARDRDATYAELEKRARDQAIALLREALAQLEAHELADLDHPKSFDP